jgi:carboxyl-terminal processing protease
MSARHWTWGVAVALGTLAAGCGGGEAPSGPATTPKDPALEPRVYLDSAINIMENVAFYRRRVDWPTVRATARTMAAGATTTAGTYPAIRYALSALGDRHSFLQPSATAPSAARAPLGVAGTLALTPPADSIDGEIVGGRYGYLRVPTFGGSNDQAVLLADTLQFLVGLVDTRTPCGWVIDLRHNFGGNMWPMLIGVGPLLGAVSVGSFVDADGGVLGWWYENGLAGASPAGYRSTYLGMSRAPYTLRVPNPAIALLTDSLTASSGEAIAVAFRGRPQTRSFGGATYGVPTANLGFWLADRALLVVMNSLDADRTGKQYDDRIPPDVVIPQTGGPATDDATVIAATSWLATQPACTAAP